MGSQQVKNILTEILTEQNNAYTPYEMMIPEGGTLEARNPTYKEKIANYLGQNIFEGGRSGQAIANNIMDFADWTPPSMLWNAPQEFKNIQTAGGIKNLKSAALPALMLGAELTGTGKVAKDVTKGIAKNLDIYNKNPFSRPEYKGQPPDRSTFTYLRYNPKKLPPRMQLALNAIKSKNSKFKAEMVADIRRGQKLGGDSWYNTEELRDWFINELGEKNGDAHWRHFMSLMGGTSPGSNVMANIKNAAYVRKRMLESTKVPGTNKTYLQALKEVTGIDDARILARTRAEGFGHMAAGAQEMALSRYAKGKWEPQTQPGMTRVSDSSLLENPKPKGFTQSFLGNQTNIAADLHFTRYMGMASGSPDWLNNTSDVGKNFKEEILSKYPKAKKYFQERKVTNKDGKVNIQDVFSPKKAVKDGVVPMDAIKDQPTIWTDKPNDNEYAAFETYINELADELNMSPSQVQANLWMGAAAKTGVEETSQGTFMEVLRERAKVRADQEGITPAQAIRNFIRNEGSGLLSVMHPMPLLATGAAGAGAYNIYNNMGDLNEEDL